MAAAVALLRGVSAPNYSNDNGTGGRGSVQGLRKEMM